MASVLDSEHFQDETAAYAHVEKLLWQNGPVCPHCGNFDGEKTGRLNGKTTRPGLRKCYEGLSSSPSKSERFSKIATLRCVCGSRRSISCVRPRKESARANSSALSELE
jgi:hypothetical protein